MRWAVLLTVVFLSLAMNVKLAFAENIVQPMSESINVDVVADQSLFIGAAKAIFALLAVLALAYLLLNKGLGRWLRRTQQSQKIKLIERYNLDHKKSLYLVELGGHQYFLGATEGNISLISKTDVVNDANLPAVPPFSSRIIQNFKGGA